LCGCSPAGREVILELNEVHQRAGEALKLAEGKAMRAMMEAPSAANITAFLKAHKAVEAVAAGQQQAADEAGAGESGGERVFRNPRQVAAYLSEQGWKVSENTAYNHRDRGMLRPDRDGLFRESDVLRYAASNLKRKDGGGSERLEALQERRALADIVKAEVQTAKARLQQEIMEGKYITKEEHFRAMATRARLLKADMLNFGRLYVENLIHIVGGDPGQAPEALAFVERQVEQWLNRYATQGEIRLAAGEGGQA